MNHRREHFLLEYLYPKLCVFVNLFHNVSFYKHVNGRTTLTTYYFLRFKEADSDPTGEGAVKTQQMLTYYELDLGLNHVVRKYSEQLEEHANLLISGKDSIVVPSLAASSYSSLNVIPDKL